MDLTEIHIYKPIIYNNWWRGSVLRTSDFPWSMPDLWLTCDHFVGKVSAMGQPTNQANLAIHPSGVGKWTVIYVITWITGVETIAVYRCLIVGQSPWEWA